VEEKREDVVEEERGDVEDRGRREGEGECVYVLVCCFGFWLRWGLLFLFAGGDGEGMARELELGCREGGRLGLLLLVSCLFLL
jgi:hypothetical protein